MTEPATSDFSRPVFLSEWHMPAQPSDSMMVIQLFVQGRGAIDPDALRCAVARAGDACPGSRQRRDGRRWVDSGLAPEVRVIDSR
ncbi:hypothetical protein ACIA74_30175 [Streptomyces sp. NPDC051658]|uniref:hypothetical protein n=1 Tax=Streptomyces sp. NPDC051658 TaxID=3365667 RepID=UPI003787AFF0